MLALCEANLDDSIDSSSFSVRVYPPLIWKDPVTHMHGLAVYVKEGLPFARDLSLENSADSYLCFWLALLHLVSYFFFIYRSPSSLLFTVFESISSNIDEILSINPSANAFVLGVFNVHYKDWFTYSWGNSAWLRSLTFLLGSQNVILTVLLFWIYFFFLVLVFVLQWLSLHWEILILLSQFSLTFHHIHNGIPHFIALLITILCWLWLWRYRKL